MSTDPAVAISSQEVPMDTTNTSTPDQSAGAAAAAAAVTNATVPSDPPPTTPVGEETQRAIIESLRNEMKARDSANAAEILALRTRTAAFDARNGAFVQSAHPDIMSSITQLIGDEGTTAEEAGNLDRLSGWMTGLKALPSNQLENEMPFMVFAAKASAKAKRARDADLEKEESGKALAAMALKVDEKNAQLEKAQRQLSDMEELAVDRQRANAELTKTIQKGIGYHNRHDFSFKESRERSAAVIRAQEALENGNGDTSLTSTGEGKKPIANLSTTCAAEAGNALDAGALQTTIGRASQKTRDPFETNATDMAAWVRNRGQGGLKFHQSPSSSHHLIGSSSNGAASSSASTEEIAAALRYG
jgi:hypothetical protein